MAVRRSLEDQGREVESILKQILDNYRRMGKGVKRMNMRKRSGWHELQLFWTDLRGKSSNG